MKNGDKPSHPTKRHESERENEYPDSGLTKREYFAGLAMQGLLHTLPQRIPSNMEEQLAKTAIACADELLKQLDQ